MKRNARKKRKTKLKPFLISFEFVHCFAYEMNLFKRLSDFLLLFLWLVVYGHCQYLYVHLVSRKQAEKEDKLLESNTMVSRMCCCYITSNYAIKITVWYYSDSWKISVFMYTMKLCTGKNRRHSL